MAAINSTLRVVSALYDFTVDGGAIGVIRLGVYFPPNAQLINFSYSRIIPFTSAGATNIAFGVSTISLVTFISTTKAGYTNNAANQPGLFTFGKVPNTGGELTMQIFGATPLTAGKYIVSIVFIEQYVQ